MRTGLIALLCAGLTACAALAPVMLPPLVLTAGVVGISGLACSTDPLCEAEVYPCLASDGKNIEVTEPSGIAIPADEGRVATFAPAYWQPQFESEGSSRAGRPAEPGTLVVTDRSVLFVPPPGAQGVRVPLAGIQAVQLQRDSSAAPRQLTVESCFGRLDRFVFGQRQHPDRLDAEATAAAGAEIRARVATPRNAKQ